MKGCKKPGYERGKVRRVVRWFCHRHRMNQRGWEVIGASLGQQGPGRPELASVKLILANNYRGIHMTHAITKYARCGEGMLVQAHHKMAV